MELERIIGKCLAKDPAERYQGAEELLADLTRLRREMSQGSTVTMQIQGIRKNRRRWPWVIGSVFALVLAAAYGIKYFTTGSEEFPSEIPRLAVLPFENVGNPEDEYFADGITEEILIRIAGIDGLRVLARNSTRDYKNSEKSIVEIGRELEVAYILEGTIRWQKQPGGMSKVSISPKLLCAREGTHLWAEAYQEDYSDIFRCNQESPPWWPLRWELNSFPILNPELTLFPR